MRDTSTQFVYLSHGHCLDQQELEFSIGKMKILENQNGLNGAAFDLPYEDALVRWHTGEEQCMQQWGS